MQFHGATLRGGVRVEPAAVLVNARAARITRESITVTTTSAIAWSGVVLLAQQVDPGGTLSGWVAAGSTVGLLGPVLYWLCYHYLPAQDAKAERLATTMATAMAAKDVQIEKLVTAKDVAVVTALAEFRKEAVEQRQHAAALVDAVCGEFRADVASERRAGEARVERLVTAFEGKAQQQRGAAS